MWPREAVVERVFHPDWVFLCTEQVWIEVMVLVVKSMVCDADKDGTQAPSTATPQES